MRSPSNIEAEQAVLGAVMFDTTALMDLDGVDGRHFFEPLHGRLWAAMQSLAASGKTADPVLLASRFKDDPAFVGLGGVSYLANLVDAAPALSVIGRFGREVVDLAVRRDVIGVTDQVAASARDLSAATAFDVLIAARQALEKLESGAAPAEVSMIAAPLCAAATLQEIEALNAQGRGRGAMTGLRCIDRRLGGLRPGMLIVVGGRPGMGKTALARAIAHGAAVRNPQALALFLGIEMGPREMMQRELSALTFERPELGAAVEYQAMTKGRLRADELAAVQQATRLTPDNLIFDDTPKLDVGAVGRKLWGLKRSRPVAVAVIDYLQLMAKPAAEGRNEASVLGQMTAELKQIARRLEVCLVLLSQLSRAVEGRDDKRPQLADLRESGAIEQDADVVLFPYRPAYYLKEPDTGKVEAHRAWEIECEVLRTRMDVICAKQRQGPTGLDVQVYQPGYDHIADPWGDR